MIDDSSPRFMIVSGFMAEIAAKSAHDHEPAGDRLAT
jgi:hypothetical protein